MNILLQFNDVLEKIKDNILNVVIDENNELSYRLGNSQNIFEIVSDCDLYKYEFIDNYQIITNKLYFKVICEKNSAIFKSDKVQKYIDEFPYKLYLELDKFSNLFQLYLKTFVVYPSEQKLLMNHKINKFIIYNYTELIKEYYHNSSNKYFCHIHGCISEGNIVFGIDSKNKKLNRFYMFYKRVQRVSKNTTVPSFISPADMKRIVIIGHSLNEADDDSLKIFLNAKYFYDEITIYYYAKDEFSKSKLTNSLIRILGEEKFDIMYNSKKIIFLPY